VAIVERIHFLTFEAVSDYSSNLPIGSRLLIQALTPEAAQELLEGVGWCRVGPELVSHPVEELPEWHFRKRCSSLPQLGQMTGTAVIGRLHLPGHRRAISVRLEGPEIIASIAPGSAEEGRLVERERPARDHDWAVKAGTA
jgi:hypothetical protein